MKSLSLGVAATLAAAALYEPLRVLVLADRFGDAVGGVGGWGGLTNIGVPRENCPTTVGGADAPYCFVRGAFLGLTPFALAVMGALTFPLAASAVAAGALRSRKSPLEPPLELMSRRALALAVTC